MNILHQLRKKQRLTLRDVEQLTGISNSYLSQLENGLIDNPGALTIKALADCYGVSVDYVLTGGAPTHTFYDRLDGGLKEAYNTSPIVHTAITELMKGSDYFDVIKALLLIILKLQSANVNLLKQQLNSPVNGVSLGGNWQEEYNRARRWLQALADNPDNIVARNGSIEFLKNYKHG